MKKTWISAVSIHWKRSRLSHIFSHLFQVIHYFGCVWNSFICFKSLCLFLKWIFVSHIQYRLPSRDTEWKWKILLSEGIEEPDDGHEALEWQQQNHSIQLEEHIFNQRQFLTSEKSSKMTIVGLVKASFNLLHEWFAFCMHSIFAYQKSNISQADKHQSHITHIDSNGPLVYFTTYMCNIYFSFLFGTCANCLKLPTLLLCCTENGSW